MKQTTFSNSLAVIDNADCCFITAGGHAHSRKKDPALQAGEPRHVCVGDQGSAVSAEDLRPQLHPQRQLSQQDSPEQRRLDGGRFGFCGCSGCFWRALHPGAQQYAAFFRFVAVTNSFPLTQGMSNLKLIVQP